MRWAVTTALILTSLLIPSEAFGDILDGLDDPDKLKFEQEEADFILLRKGDTATFYGVLITVTDLKGIMAVSKRMKVRIGTMNAHIAILEKAAKDLVDKHANDLLDAEERCNERVTHALDNLPDPPPCPEPTECRASITEWYESPIFWASVSFVIGFSGGVIVVMYVSN